MCDDAEKDQRATAVLSLFSVGKLGSAARVDERENKLEINK